MTDINESALQEGVKVADELQNPTPVDPLPSSDSLVAPPYDDTLTSLMELMYTPSFTGNTISIKIPQVASQLALFAYRVSPVLTSPSMTSRTASGTQSGRPIFPQVFAVPTNSTVSTSITNSWTQSASFSSDFASGYRYWRGPMMIRLTITSSFAVGGRLAMAFLPVTRIRPLNKAESQTGAQPLTVTEPTIFEPISLSNVLSAPHIELDLSSQHEVDLIAPSLPTFTDEHAYVHYMTRLNSTSINPALNFPTPQTFLVVAARGAISSAVSSATLDIQIDTCPLPGMQLSGFIGFNPRSFIPVTREEEKAADVVGEDTGPTRSDACTQHGKEHAAE